MEFGKTLELANLGGNTIKGFLRCYFAVIPFSISYDYKNQARALRAVCCLA
jgi:hypothetical protein